MKKTTTFLLAATLALGSIVTPVKKAEASLLIVNPIFFVVGISLSTAAIIPFITSYEQIKDSGYDRAFNGIWFAVFSISVLDKDLDKMEGALAKEFPSIPSYIIAEASEIMKNKAKLVDFNENGFKSVAMSDQEFKSLELAMTGDEKPSEVSAFKKMLTTVEIKQ